jgi:PAS domain S-box-containing protein
MIERLQEGAALLSSDGILLYVNRRLAEMLRSQAEQLTLASFRDVVVSTARPEFDQLLRQSSPGDSRGELVLTAHDGSQVPVAVALSDLTTGEIPLVCMVVTDLSEQRRSQDMIAARTTETEMLTVRLRALTSKLVLAEQRERRRFASELHDYLAQNLIVCRMAIDRMMRSSTPEQRTTLEEASTGLSECIAYCRNMVADLSPTVLYEAGLYAALRWLGHRMARHGLQVDLELEESYRPGEDQAVILFQAVRELLFNVLKHAGVDRVRVQARDSNGVFSLVVIDAGQGFDPKVPLAAGSTMGFGLFAVREHLSTMGGRVEIESGPHGTRITLSVPHPFEATRPAAQAGAKVRVLLVDDHATVRDGLRRILTADPELEIVGEASHGEEAVSLARALRPDVVLMDVHMPKTDGIAATRALKSELAATRVIGLSMHDSHEFADAMIEAGASAYLTKDVRGDELLAAVRAIAAGVPRTGSIEKTAS